MTGHKRSNEIQKAGILAKEGANTPLPGTEPFSGLSKGIPVKRTEHATGLIKQKKNQLLLGLHKENPGITTGLLNGHFQFKYDISKIGRLLLTLQSVSETKRRLIIDEETAILSSLC